MNKEYLPSKIFMTRVAVILIIAVTIFGVSKLVGYLKNKNQNSNKPVKVTLVKDLIQKDTNNNGIADWEEYLWGLDPKKNGPENKEYILSKKKTLMEKGEISSSDNNSITDNDILSQGFFATIVSLQQTGQLNEESMKSVSEIIGKNIEAKPIDDVYDNSMLVIQSDSTMTNDIYREKLSELVKKYTDANIGSEITFIIQGLSNNDPQALYAAKTVGEAYQSFGRELIKIPVPRGLALTHLSAANNYEKVGQTILDLTQILSDSLIGMKSLINYKNYSDALASDLEKISEFLQ